MVSTPEGYTKNSPMTPNPYVYTEILRSRKTLLQLSDTSDVKHKTAICGLSASMENSKELRTGNLLWSNIEKGRGHTK